MFSGWYLRAKIFVGPFYGAEVLVWYRASTVLCRKIICLYQFKEFFYIYVLDYIVEVVVYLVLCSIL